MRLCQSQDRLQHKWLYGTMGLVIGDSIQLTLNHNSKKRKSKWTWRRATKEVSNIGLAYFYDDLDRYTPSEIIARIKKEILDATKLQGLHDSEITRDAFHIVLENLEDKELDNILDNEYGLLPKDVGGRPCLFPADS